MVDGQQRRKSLTRAFHCNTVLSWSPLAKREI